MESYFIKAYLIYLPIVIVLTFLVARTLFQSGKTFMLDIFSGREEIANATNQLFKVGFYLLNLGFGLLIMKVSVYGSEHLDSNRELIEILSGKIGKFAVYLGIMLFFNLFLFFRGKKKAREQRIQRQAKPIAQG
ncbi:MAG: hypothetical protein CMP59_00690 [Flavobacteriales bacterium]|nr:hypothetical protein [Flavobacteriales bacterium]|tara:strand:- start:47 stop:448 length:402 start_codon:yes stop_codon:yes gene_type:complete